MDKCIKVNEYENNMTLAVQLARKFIKNNAAKTVCGIIVYFSKLFFFVSSSLEKFYVTEKLTDWQSPMKGYVQMHF